MADQEHPLTQLRLGDAERERAAVALAHHFSAGRLELAEYDERVSAVYRAKTQAELTPLFVDLPVAARPDRPRTHNRALPRGVLLLLVLLVLAVAFTAAAGFPPWFLFPIWFWSRRLHSRGSRSSQTAYG